MTTETVYVAGLKVTPLPIATAVEMYLADALAGRARVYIFVNGHSAILRRSNVAYAAALEDSLAVGLVDGAAVEIAGLLRGLFHVQRCPGPDFFAAAACAAADSGISFYLLGGNVGVAELVAERLTAEHPVLTIAGVACPPFGAWDNSISGQFIDAIKLSGAQALWLGVSAPKQEIWAVAHAKELSLPIACVGAAFDFVTGSHPRAPRWMRALRLEWLFRLISDPKRLWRRYLIGNVIFIWDAVRFGSRRPRNHSAD